MTGTDRATFCNTGSEAVMAAMRAARTVTGRTKIVYFTGDYHGTFDEVLARANGTGDARRAVPIAPGIPDCMTDEIVILDYGTPETLEILRGLAPTLAAVLVEPVQSRRPDVAARRVSARSPSKSRKTRARRLSLMKSSRAFAFIRAALRRISAIQADLVDLRQNRRRWNAHRHRGRQIRIHGCL